jgi:hypothetical protein
MGRAVGVRVKAGSDCDISDHGSSVASQMEFLNLI